MRRSRKRISLDHVDIRSVMDELEIDYTESGKNVSEGWIGTQCPFCGDMSNHLGVSLRSPVISCFNCGTTGSYLKLITEETNNFSQALDILRKHTPRELRNFHDEYENKSSVSKVELPKKASTKITRYHKSFLNGRGFDHKDLESRYNLLYCGPFGDWSNRIIIPVVRRNRILTFTSCDIADETPLRYKHLKDELSIVSIKHLLLGIERTDGRSAIVVEGLFDHYRVGDGSIAAFGTVLTVEQKLLLSKFSRLVIAFDGDEAGRKGAENIANDMGAFCDVEIADLPDGSDPDKLCESDLKELRGMI